MQFFILGQRVREMNCFLFLRSKFPVKENRIKLMFINVFQVLQVKLLRQFAYIWITLQDFPTLLLYQYLIKKSVKGKKKLFLSFGARRNFAELGFTYFLHFA